MFNWLVNRKFASSFFVFIFFVGNSVGQSYRKTDSGIRLSLPEMEVDLQFYTSGIVRVCKSPKSIQYHPESFSVVKTPEKVSFQVMEKDSIITLKSDRMDVYVNLKTGKVGFMNSDGHNLLSETDYGTQFTPVKYDKVSTCLVRQSFRLDSCEAIYGLGQHQAGKMNQRNQALLLRQENTEIAIPFFQSTKGYGLFWDNTAYTLFTDNDTETAFESYAGECVDYYFINGGNADNVIRGMRELTGQVPMNALWTYGFWQSRERYQSQEELVNVVKKYRELQVPLDGIIQDWQYWGTDQAFWNAIAFNNPKFSNPQKMVDEVHGLNAHIAISIWPSFGTKTNLYKTFQEKGMLLSLKGWPDSALPYDPFNPEARAIYWKAIKENMYSIGIDGWWLDATEPELNVKDYYAMKQNTYAGPYQKVANAFPIASVGGVYENQRKLSSDKRVFILTRSAFAGQQRYGATSWSGDVKSSWDVLHKQISAGLNFSACGIPYWNTDIGGFASCNFYPEGVNDLSYRELYVRWNQFGAFTPMMRSHGTCSPREIYQFGEKGTWAFDAIKKYIDLRYKMLPYIYSTAWQVSRYGDTFMRALFMDFPQDTIVHDLNNQYLFGRSLLVVPVTRPMYVGKDKTVNLKNIQTTDVYLPSGINWFDFWTGEQLLGGQKIAKETPIDIMPIYVKAGSILPLGPEVQYAEEKSWDTLEIRVYPGADGNFVLYEDEFDNYNYEKGLYSTIAFHWDNTQKTLTIGERKGDFPGMLKKRNFRIVLVDNQHGAGDNLMKKADRSVSYTGKECRIRLFD